MAPAAGSSHYPAAKAGSEAIVRSAAFELGARGIRCNAVLPGVVRTPLMAPMLERDGVSESFVERTPLGRIADGSDIADVVAFLASPAARWITGVSLPVDGGQSQQIGRQPSPAEAAEERRAAEAAERRVS